MSDTPTMSEANPLSRVIGMAHEEVESLKRIERLAWAAHAANGGSDPHSDGDAVEHREALRRLRAALHGSMATIKVHFDLVNRLESAADRAVRKAEFAKRDPLTVAHKPADPVIDDDGFQTVHPTIKQIMQPFMDPMKFAAPATPSPRPVDEFDDPGAQRDYGDEDDERGDWLYEKRKDARLDQEDAAE